MAIYFPPTPLPSTSELKNFPTVFLAGSIEQGKAEDWQSIVATELEGQFHFFNPRRPSWDHTWKQSINNPKFKEQVVWELDGLELCDHILMVLKAGTQSPISLLELGLMAKSEKMIVVCEPDFWRKGNVEIVCDRFQIPLFETLQEGMNFLFEKNRT